jgi:hypothetical protein
MKKAFFAFMSGVLLSPLLVGAVTWQMDSSPFSFPAVSTINGNHMIVSQSAIRCNYDAVRGIVAIRYTLPKVAKNAKLNIYNIGGVMIKTFDCAPGSNAIAWNLGSNKVAAGIYLASMRYGNVENKTQISIVK